MPTLADATNPQINHSNLWDVQGNAYHTSHSVRDVYTTNHVYLNVTSDAELGLPLRLHPNVSESDELLASGKDTPHTRALSTGSHEMITDSWRTKSHEHLLDSDFDRITASRPASPSRRAVYTFSRTSLLRSQHKNACWYGFSSNGDEIIHGCARNLSVEKHSLTTHSWAPTMTLKDGPADFVQLSNDGRRLVSVHCHRMHCTLSLWDIEVGRPLGQPTEVPTRTFIKVSPSCRTAFVCDSHGHVQIYDLERRQSIIGNAIESHGISCASFSSDERFIVSIGSKDSRITIWNAETAAIIAGPHLAPSISVTCAAISRDGQRVIVGSKDGQISAVDAGTGRILSRRGGFTGHGKSVRSLAFSRDDMWLVSASSDKTVRLWDSETGLAISEPLKGHTASVAFTCFSHDERKVLSHGDDKTVGVWTLRAPQPPIGTRRLDPREKQHQSSLKSPSSSSRDRLPDLTPSRSWRL